MKTGDQFEVTIEKMSLHGGALARHEGLVIFVDFAAAGDRLLVELTELKKNLGLARIVEILNPSSDRRKAPCPVFGRCGGCGWQHLTEEAQQNWKSQLVKEALDRVWKKDFNFLPLVKSPEVFRYRNRIQLKKRGSEIGYFAKGSHQLVSIDDCPLAEEPLIKAFPKLRSQGPRKEALGKSGFESWEISLNKENDAEIHPLSDRDLHFSQVNRFTNQLLIDEVLSWASDYSWTSYWDLYCGSGNFTFPLAEKFPKSQGLGVELSESGIQGARKEAQKRNWSPKRLEFFKADVGIFTRRMAPAEGSLVLLDPPRAGLEASVVQSLAQSQAQVLLYISCDPMSLARDLGRFQEQAPGRWHLNRVRCFDMFPQTEHVETLVELIRQPTH